MADPVRTILADVRKRLAVVLGGAAAELVLFGSRARGDYDESSDIDVAIIVPGLDAARKDRILEAVADVEFRHARAVSALVISKEDFDRLLERERRIALDIRREGVAL